MRLSISKFYSLAATISLAALPLGAVAATVTVPLTSLFPGEDPAVLSTFDSTSSLTADPIYKSLYKKCRSAFNDDPICQSSSAVLGTVNRAGASIGERGINRMTIIRANGNPEVKDVTIGSGNLVYDPAVLTGTTLGLIHVAYYRTSANSGSPLVTCEADVIVCSPGLAGCPATEPSHCVPVTNSGVSNTSGSGASCSCPSGQVLTSCAGGIPACVNPPGCPSGQVRLTDGSCAVEHTCAMHNADLANQCIDSYTIYSLIPGYYPPDISCRGLDPGVCPPPNSNPPVTCQPSFTVTSIVQPTTATSTDGKLVFKYAPAGFLPPMSVNISPGVGTNFTEAQVPGGITERTYTGLHAGSYGISMTDSTTPIACEKSVWFMFAPTGGGGGGGTGCQAVPAVVPAGQSCSDLAPNYCGGVPFNDGCGSACPTNLPNVKTAGCGGPPPNMCPSAPIYANTQYWALDRMPGSDLAIATLPQSLTGTVVHYTLPDGNYQSKFQTFVTRNYTVVCGTQARWEFTAAASPNTPQPPTGCNGTVPAVNGLPEIEYYRAFDPNSPNPCAKQPNDYGPANHWGTEDTALLVTPMPNGTTCTPDPLESTISGTVGAVCTLTSNSQMNGVIKGFKRVEYNFLDATPNSVVQTKRWHWNVNAPVPKSDICNCE